MKRTLVSLTALILTSAFPSGPAIAAEHSPVTITELFKQAHPEQADKEVIVKRIELQPGVADMPHVHAGMITGYIEAGTFEFQIKGGPRLTLKAGETFFEPPGSHHLVARNPDRSTKTVLIVFVINPKGAPLSTPLK